MSQIERDAEVVLNGSPWLQQHPERLNPAKIKAAQRLASRVQGAERLAEIVRGFAAGHSIGCECPYCAALDAYKYPRKEK